MKTQLIQDDAQAIRFLQSFKPEWIEELPLLTASRAFQSNIVQEGYYNEKTRHGALASFFGQGFKGKEAGWYIISVTQASEREFNAVALAASLPFQFAVAQSKARRS